GGLTELEDGVKLYEGLTAPPVFWPILLTIQGRANLLAGRVEAAAALFAEADVAATAGDPVVIDLAIARGDVLLAGASPDTAGAEESYERAAGMARTFGLRMAELEAATRLAQLRAGTAGDEDSLRRLRGLLDAFTEGHSTPQLTAAAALARGH
ncbi:MAG TPA: hypothetical protein VEV43_08740, partial [Actinomycetota bacterium]|nr:hypothetical protein [Actinomycetota bacterium]